MDGERDKVWVLTHAYYDNRAFKVIRAYRTEERATEDLELLLDTPETSGKIELHKVDCYGDGDL